MNGKITLLVTLLPFLVVSTSIDGQARAQDSSRSSLQICAKPNGLLFARKKCQPNEKELDLSLRSESKIIFRDVEHQAMVDPGEELVAAALCDIGEVVVSGGYSTQPELPMRVTLDTFFFDGQRSGWRVDLLNVADVPTMLGMRLNVSCTKGRGVSGAPVVR